LHAGTYHNDYRNGVKGFYQIIHIIGMIIIYQL